MNAHEEIQFKITAFLFNRRADALREEMYQALCITVLKEAGHPFSYDEIIEKVVSALGIPSGVTESLRTIIIDELNQLSKDGKIVKESGCYSLPFDSQADAENENGTNRLLEIIRNEIRAIATNIDPDITEINIKRLIDFYIEVTDVVAKHQVNFAPKGFRLQELSTSDENIHSLVQECADKHRVAEIIDISRFIQRSLIRPTEELADYIYKLIQVSIISQLLTWDPSLEYLHNRLMARKVLYLDSSILFCLMQTTDPLHEFVKSMLIASKKDLGVTLKVHASTIDEYQGVIDAYNSRFSNENRYLRDIAKSCRENGEDPADYLDSSIFVDYISRSINHIDLGSWQRYYTSMSGKSVEDTVKSMGVVISRDIARVPDEIFWKIKDALARASSTQFERGKRKHEKLNLDHDARIFHLVLSTRKKDGDDWSLSYDTFLLTLDGSLPYFLKEYGLSWTETYFMFPSQWYQLTFPFLRIGSDQRRKVSLGMTFMAFSTAFPSLAKLVPLELCEYIFDEGGNKLSLGAVSEVVKRLYEERLITSLDPNNKDIQRKETARLRVQRIIAEAEMAHRQSILSLEQEKEGLEQQKGELDNTIETLSTEKQSLESQRALLLKEVDDLQVRKKQMQETEVPVSIPQQHVTAHETTQNEVHLAEIANLQQALNSQKEQSTQQIDYLRNEIAALRSERDAEKVEAMQKKVQTQRAIISIVVPVFMIGGLLTALMIMISLQINMYMIIAVIGLMAIGAILFNRFVKTWFAYSIYAIGGIVFAIACFDKTQTLPASSFIPLGMDVIAKILEILLDKKMSK